MKNIYMIIVLILCIVFECFSQTSRTTAAFTPNNIVVYRTGNGVTPLVDQATPVFLDEYTSAGVLVQTIPLPTSPSGSNNILTASGGADGTGEGMMTLSVNKEYLVFTGYNAPIGTVGPNGNLSSTTSATFPRVIGLVKYDGTINTSTSLSGFASQGVPFSAISTNGIDLWASGNSLNPGTTEGVQYTTIGSSSSVQINNVGFIHGLGISNGQLYASSFPGTIRVGMIGTGLPTTTGQSFTSLPPNIPTSGLGGPWQFVFADMDASIPGPDVLYVADIGAPALRKYSFNGTNWLLNGTIGSSADDYRGVTLQQTSSTSVTLFATRKRFAAGGGELVSLVDASGWNGAFAGTPTVLATAATNTAFQGVALSPEAPAISCSGTAMWNGTINNDYNTPGNWSTNCVPNAGMDIIIPSGSNPMLTGATVAARNINVQVGATISLNDGAILNVKGDFINDGTIVSGGTPADGKIAFNGTVAQNISGLGIYSYVEINNLVDVFVLSNITVKGVNSLPNAKLTVNSFFVVTVSQ